MTHSPSLNVASHLTRMGMTHPDQVAIHAPVGRVDPHGHTPHRAITFAELHTDSDAIAHGFNAVNITRGTRTALMVPPSPDFFALTFALLKIGAVPVLIDPGMGVKNLGKCLAEAEPHAFVGTAKAHAARRVLGWAKQTLRTTVNAGRWRFFCTTSLARLRKAGRGHGAFAIPQPEANETAAILFTSGSTGIAKGVVYTHGIFSAQIELLKQTYGIEPGEIDLCTFPLFALFAPALGMTCVIPDMDASRPARIDPAKAMSQIRQFSVTNMFGSPAVIRRLGELEEPNPPAPFPPREGGVNPPPPSLLGKGAGGLGCLPSLRRVISAGAPASAASIERFVKLLPPSAEVFTPYGATESLPVANISSREILTETRQLTEQGKGVCVGRPVAGMEVRVIRISDEAIAEWNDSLLAASGEVGEFVVRGPVVTREYYNRPEATKLAKIRDPKTGEVLHRMGDVGYLDDRGRLWFCGRKSQRVVTPDGTLFTDMVEPIFNMAWGVEKTALVGVTRKGVTYPVLCISPYMGRYAPWSKIQTALRDVAARHEHTRRISTYLHYAHIFPVDVRHNSKIFREKLAVWADKQLGPTWNLEEKAGVEATV